MKEYRKRPTRAMKFSGSVESGVEIRDTLQEIRKSEGISFSFRFSEPKVSDYYTKAGPTLKWWIVVNDVTFSKGDYVIVLPGGKVESMASWEFEKTYEEV